MCIRLSWFAVKTSLILCPKSEFQMTRLTFVLISLLSIAVSLASCATSRQISSGNTNMCMNVEWHGYPVAGVPLRVKPCDPWQN